MHIPYIRKVFSGKDISLVPLMVGHIPEDSFETYGKVLSKYFNDPETLFVVSTDFCHWGKRFKFTHIFPESQGSISDSIEKLDRMGMNLIE